MINLLSWGETYHYSQYKVLNLTNLQIYTFLYIKFSDVNYMKNNKIIGIIMMGTINDLLPNIHF